MCIMNYEFLGFINNNMKHCVYLLTRDDGKMYVGITIDYRFHKRMYFHSRDVRFKDRNFKYEILCRNYIEQREEYWILKFDTWNYGLNETKNGKGNHGNPNFSTYGYKFSDKSKKKMSEFKIKLYQEKPELWNNIKHTKEQKLKWSLMRKGKIHFKKYSDKTILEIRDLYNTNPNCDDIGNGVGNVQPNGKILTYERAFSKKFCGKFGMTKENLYKIITRKSRNDI